MKGWYAAGLPRRQERCQERAEYKDIEVDPLQESTEDGFREFNYSPRVIAGDENGRREGLTAHEVGNAKHTTKEQ